MASQIIFDFVNPPQDEGNTGDLTIYNYSLTRIGDLDQPVTVNWEVSGTGDSPVNADDFVGGVLPSGQVTFDAGQTLSESFNFKVAGDLMVFEGNEQFLVGLTLAPNSPPIPRWSLHWPSGLSSTTIRYRWYPSPRSSRARKTRAIPAAPPPISFW